MWMHSVCFMGIWCGTKTSASFLFFCLFFFCRWFLFPVDKKKFCHRNLHFQGQFPCRKTKLNQNITNKTTTTCSLFLNHKKYLCSSLYISFFSGLTCCNGIPSRDGKKKKKVWSNDEFTFPRHHGGFVHVEIDFMCVLHSDIHSFSLYMHACACFCVLMCACVCWQLSKPASCYWPLYAVQHKIHL